MTTTDKRKRRKSAHAHTGRTETTASFPYRTFRCRDFYRISPVFRAFWPICSPAPERTGRWISPILSFSIRPRSFNTVKNIPSLLFPRSFWPSCSRKALVPWLTSCQASESPFQHLVCQYTKQHPGSGLFYPCWVETFAYCLEEAGCTSPNQKEGSNWPFRLTIMEIPMPPGLSPITAVIPGQRPGIF